MMNQKNRLIEIIGITILTVILFAIPYVSLWKNFRMVPSGRYYFGSVDYAIDVLGNFDTIRQGFLGHWQRTPNKTVLLEGKPTYLKFEYILIGQTARATHTDPIVLYYVTRAVISLLTVGMIIWLVYHVFSRPVDRIVSVVIIFFGTGITEFWKNYPMRVMDVMPGDTLVFERLTTAAPHYLLGILLPLVSIYAFAQFIDRKKFIFFIISVISGMLATFIFSPSMILVAAVLPLVFVKRRAFREAIILYAIVSLLPIGYIRYVSQFWDFNVLSKTESVVPFRLDPWQYLFVVGVPYLLSLFAIRPLLRSKNTLFLLFIPWVLMHPIAALALANVAMVNPSRFFFGPYFVIFGILATIGLRYIAKTKKIVYILGILFLVSSSYYSYGASLQYTRVCFCNVQFFDYGYPKKDLMDAIFWLRDNTKESDVVFSGPYAGVLIPAFSGNKVYTSFWLRFMDETTFSKTESVVHQLYSGSIRREEIRALAGGYVLFGDEERQIAGNNTQVPYPFLQQVYESGQTRIYKIIRDAP